MRKQYSWHAISAICVLVILVSLISSGKASSNSTQSTPGPIESCAQSPIQQNVTLRGGINAGSFKKLAQFVAMQLCIRLCCEEKGCDVALMSGKNCYGVQCFSEELCTAVPAKKAPSSLMISHVTIKGEEGNSRRIHPVPQNLKCTESEAEEGVTLKGGIGAGNFTDVGTVENVDSCTRLCCVSEKCDLALVIKGHCFLVACFSKELCKTVKSETKNYRPTVAFVRRWITNVTEDTAITLSNLPATNSKLMCKNSDIKYNSTLKGGIKAGNFTDLGKIAEISTCIRMCCGRKDCDVALMLEANCYAVNCYNEDLCQPVLARKSGLLTNLSPRLSFITSRDEEVLPQKIVIGDGVSCRPSVVSYDVTLRGGLSAGKFTPVGHVDSMEACVSLCCHRNTCDIALMLRDSCYSITCVSEELCEEVPAPSSDFYPRLSYVRRDNESLSKKEHVQSKPETSQQNDTQDDLDAKEEGYCTNSEVMTNVTLRGGIATGRFRDRGKVPNMKACVEICCISKTCDVAFLLKNNCFSVTCFNERLCEAVRARSSIYIPKIVYIYARTKSEMVAPTRKRRNKRLKRRTNEEQFTEVEATNFKRRVGKDRFKRQMHRKVDNRNMHMYRLDQRPF